MPIVPNHYRPADHGRAAHDTVSVSAAMELYDRDDVHWPVSGDVTAVGYGTIGCRRHADDVNLWSAPGVTRRRHADVRVGDTITTHAGTGVVTAKGTIAGWYVVDGVERRWDGRDVLRIQRAPVTA